MNMKYSNLYIIPVLVAAIASCTKAEGPEGGVSLEGRAVSISVSVDAAGVSGAGTMAFKSNAAGSPVTRAEGSIPYAGSTLGLFLDYGKDSSEDPAPYTQSNILWNNDGSNNWTAAAPMLWGKASDNVGVYAYAPYLEGQTDASGVEFTIPTDQSEGLGAADLLWWYPGIENNKRTEVTAGSFTDGKIDIAFRHALIKLTVNFELASQFKGQNISIKEAWFHRSGNKVKIDFGGSYNGNVPSVMGDFNNPDYTVCSIKMHDCSAEGKLSCEVLFFPGPSRSDNKLLTVTLSDGRDYILTLDKNLELQTYESGFYVTGIAYEMNVKVGKDKLEGGTVTVAPWTDKGSLGDNFGTDATEYSEWGGPEDIATAYAGGDGSQNNPYLIETAAQLAFLAQEANSKEEYTWPESPKYFKLTANINLKGYEWTPIGTVYKRFVGSFDGDGHVIVNLNVKDAWYAGLFGWIQNGATVKNLVIRNASVSSVSQDSESVSPHNPQAYSGIVAAYCSAGCTISNCKVDGTVTSDYCAGGIVGYSDNSSKDYDGSITSCTADVVCSVANSAKDAYCGGIAGILSVKLDACTVRGKVDGTVSAGGLVGWLSSGGVIGSDYGHVNYVYADVSLSSVCIPNMAYYDVGGLVGSASYGTKISSCYMYGRVWCAEGLELTDVAPIYVGGVIGYTDGVELLACHSFASVTAGKPANGKLGAGAFIGYLGAGVKASRCSYRIDGAAGLPVYGYKKDGTDDSGIDVEVRE